MINKLGTTCLPDPQFFPLAFDPILHEIEAAQGVINLQDLSNKLGIDRSALEGMIQYWVRKGRLKDDSQTEEIPLSSCTSSSSCGHSCSGPQGCPFVMEMPKTYTLRTAH